MSQLIDTDPSMKIPPEDQGYEFDYYLFDPLPPISIEEILVHWKRAEVRCRAVTKMLF